MTLFERDDKVGGLWQHSVKIPKPCTDGGSVDGEALAGTSCLFFFLLRGAMRAHLFFFSSSSTLPLPLPLLLFFFLFFFSSSLLLFSSSSLLFFFSSHTHSHAAAVRQLKTGRDLPVDQRVLPLPNRDDLAHSIELSELIPDPSTMTSSSKRESSSLLFFVFQTPLFDTFFLTFSRLLSLFVIMMKIFSFVFLSGVVAAHRNMGKRKKTVIGTKSELRDPLVSPMYKSMRCNLPKEIMVSFLV